MIRLAIIHFLSAVGLKLWPHCEPFFKRNRKLGLVLFLICVLGIVFTALFGCANAPQLESKTYYRHDMLLTVDGVNAEGTFVAPKQKQYLIAVTSQEDIDTLQITTCNRDDVIPPQVSGWFKPKRSYMFYYQPTMIEKEPGCLLKLAGLSKASGRHSWAFIDFEHEDYELPAGVACNGAESYRSNGVSVCQSLQGLYQMIYFGAPVALSAKVLDRCKIPTSPNGIHWKFKIPNRECVYLFIEKRPPYRRHRLTTVGYEDVPVRVE